MEDKLNDHSVTDQGRIDKTRTERPCTDRARINQTRTERPCTDQASLHKLVIVDEEDAVYYGYFAGDQPVELYCEQKSQKSLVGQVYAAQVYRVAEGIGGAFLHTVDGDCFLPGVSGLKGGDILPVQIFKDGVGRKLPVAGANISINGKYFVFTFANKRLGVSKKIRNPRERERLTALIRQEMNPPVTDRAEDSLPGLKNSEERGEVFDFGIVARTNAEGVPEDLLIKEFHNLARVCRRIADKSRTAAGGSLLYHQTPYYIQLGQELPAGELGEIVTDSEYIYREWKDYYTGREDIRLAERVRYYQDDYPLKNLYRFDHHFQTACQRRVWLKSGGSIVIDHTEAMTVIDVNSGAVTRSRHKAERIFLSMNLEAAEEIARQLRIRNISGIILVDFINMKSAEDQASLLKALATYCKTDRSRVRVIDYTALGLVEMTRDKSRKPLRAQLGKNA